MIILYFETRILKLDFGARQTRASKIGLARGGGHQQPASVLAAVGSDELEKMTNRNETGRISLSGTLDYPNLIPWSRDEIFQSS